MHVDNGGLTGVDLEFAQREANLPFGTASRFTGWNAEGQYNFNRSIGLGADAMACPLRVIGFWLGRCFRTGQNQESRPSCMYLLATTLRA